MTSQARCAAFILLVAVTTVSSMSAQQPRRGLWGEFGTGAGFLRVACAGCTEVVTNAGGGGYLRIGGVISDRVFFSVESAGFLDETFGFAGDDSTTVGEMETVVATVLWFPWMSGPFLKGGVGLAQGRFAVSDAAAPADTVKGTGIGMTFGVGWDWAFSRKFALTANAAAFIAAIGDLLLPSGRVDDVIGTMYQLTIGLTIR
jgi:hypothetical protein